MLLHGFPSLSRMYRNLNSALVDRCHVIAPDFSGFGLSAMSGRAGFEYRPAKYASLVDGLLERLSVASTALYVMNYGGPVDLRLAPMRPERVTALVVHNGNTYEGGGLPSFLGPLKAYWTDGPAAKREVLRSLMSLKGTKFRRQGRRNHSARTRVSR